MELLRTFDYAQHVKQPTHKGNHILDLIITRSEDNIIHRTTVVDPVLSDHYAVRCKVLFAKSPLEKIEITYRNLKYIDYSRFREEIKDLKLMHDNTLSLNNLVERHNTKLASLLNSHAPVRNKVVTLRPKSPWFTPEIKDQKAKLRRLERRWRKSRLTVDREIYTQQCAVVHRLIRESKAIHYTDLIEELESKPRELFGTLETLLKGRTEKLYPSCSSPQDLAYRFSDYFEEKINTIRLGLILISGDRDCKTLSLMCALNTASFYSDNSHLLVRHN